MSLDETIISEQTEMGQAFDNLDRDKIDAEGMTGVDFNTRLSSDQIGCILIIDEFKRLGLVPKHHGLTRQIKRLNVSLDGKGRAEKTAIATALISASKGSESFIGKLFGRREPQ
jgi:hypothetical protein